MENEDEVVVRVEKELEERKRMSSFGVVAHPFIFFFPLLLFVDFLLRNSLISLSTCMLSWGSQELSLVGYPFHLTR